MCKSVPETDLLLLGLRSLQHLRQRQLGLVPAWRAPLPGRLVRLELALGPSWGRCQNSCPVQQP